MGPTQKTRKGTAERFFYTVWRQAQLSLHPVIVTMAVLAGWYVFIRHNPAFWDSGFYLYVEDAELFFVCAYLLFAGVFGIFGAFLYSKTVEKIARATDALMDRNWRTVLKLRDERVTIASLVSFWTSCFFVVAPLVLFPWQHGPVGFIAIGGVTFFSAKFWALITRLDNTFRSPWLRERIPPEIMEIDIDSFFKLDGKLTDAERKELGLPSIEENPAP